MLDIHWIIIVGLGGFSSHYCLTRAFQVADTLTVIPIDFMRLPIIAIIGYVFYNEPFEIVILFGALMWICIGSLRLPARLWTNMSTSTAPSCTLQILAATSVVAWRQPKATWAA